MRAPVPGEGLLKPYLESIATPHAKKLAASLGGYKRQSVGYTDGGKRWILVNGICERYWQKNASTLRDSVIVVLDGGPCFFMARYDPSISKFDELVINGPA
jgi:hypothetical protein